MAKDKEAWRVFAAFWFADAGLFTGIACYVGGFARSWYAGVAVLAFGIGLVLLTKLFDD